MDTRPLFAVVIVTVLACSGCGGSDDQRAADRSAGQPTNPYPSTDELRVAEAPEQTSRDVAAARQDAREAEIQTDQAAAAVEAESAHRVQVEKCDALPANDRAECVARADRELARAKEEARRRLDQKMPEPE